MTKKQLNIGGKGKCCCIPVYDKDSQKTNIGLCKFSDKDAKPERYKLWCNKIKHSKELEGKIRLKLQITHKMQISF